ncbi:hypothetical protein SCP_0800160 [Sparassis crispa]|uniref:Uncharacterized protein n=1 Tax=Sparassis crispa TaxID=139825 RepID=A0A401GTJ1_9APHY|nr:hypothetical protein SCP_0800160 [Sparassis crispa]GBE85499.1 hypothetical protein SCP_0800160 [Sparassis crispa]
MGQCWRILNLDTWQVICDGGKLGEWLFYDSLPSDLVELLAIPFSGTPTRTLFTPTNALGRLELPGEILLCIFDEVDDLHDAICLGLTNTALRSVGHKRIQRLIVETTAPWAGYRIVCLGEYMHNDDLPVDMLTEEEEHIMLVKPTQEDLQDPTEYDHRHLEICATKLYNFAMEHFRTLRLQSYSEDFERQWEMPSHERKLLKELSTPLWEDTDDEDTDDEDTDDEDTDDTDAILEESTDTHESSITEQNNGEEASADDDKVSEQVDASAWVLCNLTNANMSVPMPRPH